MDPDATLEKILSWIESIRAYEGAEDLHALENAAVELADSVENLHEWIQRGGFLPAAWRRE